MIYDPTQYKNAFVVGICGLAGSGKSTASHFLAEWTGWQHLSADEINHERLRDESIKKKLFQYFGEQIFDSEGSIQRKNLAARVFGCEKSLRHLETCLWPEIKLVIDQHLHRQDNACIIDAAVLFQAGWNTFCDATIFVDCPDKIRRIRLSNKGMSTSWIDELMKIQHILEADKYQADRIICNNTNNEESFRSLLLSDILPWLQAQSRQKKEAQ